MRFTDSQRRHVALVLGGLVRETRAYLDDWERVGIRGPDGPTVRLALEHLLRDAETAADHLGIRLVEPTRDPRRGLSTWSTGWWSAVLDCRPSALRAYGEVDGATADAVAPVVEALAERLLRVEVLAREAGPARRDASSDAGPSPSAGPKLDSSDGPPGDEGSGPGG